MEICHEVEEKFSGNQVIKGVKSIIIIKRKEQTRQEDEKEEEQEDEKDKEKGKTV